MYKINELPTPCFVIDEGKLEENLKLLHQVEERTGAKILLAQKCFSCFSEYPLIRKYISGTTASGLYEARLGKEEMGLENHVYSPAYRPQDMEELAQICDHIIFNSEKQLRTYLPVLKASGTAKAGLRINPECSTQEGHAIYDPCAPGSRMGIRACDFTDELADLVDGLHFHTSQLRPTTCFAAWYSAIRVRSNRPLIIGTINIASRPALGCESRFRQWVRRQSPWTSPSRFPGSPATVKSRVAAM